MKKMLIELYCAALAARLLGRTALPAGLAAEQMAALRDFVEFLPPEDVL